MRMHEAQQELVHQRRKLDVHAQSYGERTGSGGEPSSPVASRTERLLSIEALIRRLEVSTVPVLRLRGQLKNSTIEHSRVKFFIMELYYFEGMSLVDVMIHLGKGSIGYMRVQRRRLVEQLIQEIDRFSSSR